MSASSPTPLPSAATRPPYRLVLGHKVQFLRKPPLELDRRALTQHVLIAGATGAGASAAVTHLLEQQTLQGGGWIHLASQDTDVRVLQMAAEKAGRSNEFHVIHLDPPAGQAPIGPTYSPLACGTVDEQAARLVATLPPAQNNPGVDFYREQALHALTVILGAMRAAHHPATLSNLVSLLYSAPTLEELEAQVLGKPEHRDLKLFLDTLRRLTKHGDRVDPEKLAAILGGMPGRMALLAQGRIGTQLDAPGPRIDIAEIVRSNQMLVVVLPLVRSLRHFGVVLSRVIVEEVHQAIHHRLAEPRARVERPPLVLAMDNPELYALRLYSSAALARAAGVSLLARSDLNGLAQLDDSDRNLVLGNVANRILFRAAEGTDVLSSVLKEMLPGAEPGAASKLAARLTQQNLGECTVLQPGKPPIRGQLASRS